MQLVFFEPEVGVGRARDVKGLGKGWLSHHVNSKNQGDIVRDDHRQSNNFPSSFFLFPRDDECEIMSYFATRMGILSKLFSRMLVANRPCAYTQMMDES